MLALSKRPCSGTSANCTRRPHGNAQPDLHNAHYRLFDCVLPHACRLLEEFLTSIIHDRSVENCYCRCLLSSITARPSTGQQHSQTICSLRSGHHHSLLRRQHRAGSPHLDCCRCWRRPCIPSPHLKLWVLKCRIGRDLFLACLTCTGCSCRRRPCKPICHLSILALSCSYPLIMQFWYLSPGLAADIGGGLVH